MCDDLIYKPQFSSQDVEILQQQTLYRGFVQVESVTLRHRLFATRKFSASINREIVRRREAAGVFVHDPHLKKFLLIEQFRAGAMNLADTPWQLEIIAGLIDAGEDAETCLKREALEEAGCHIEQLQFVSRYHPSTGASDEIFNFYVATADLSHCGGIHGEVSENEDIKVHLFDYEQLEALCQQGYFRNAPLIIAMQWFQLFLIQHEKT
jgi:ADP-ribose pyrophosphatase